MSALQTDRPRFHAPRRLLAVLLGVAAMIAALILLPGLISFYPSKAKGNGYLEVDIHSIKVGEYREYLMENAMPIGVYRRTPGQVLAISASTAFRYAAEVVDYDLPSGIDRATRSHHPEYFVFYPIATRWGCKVVHVPDGEKANLPGWEGGFFEFCNYDFAYDYAGWSLERPNSKAEYMWLPSRNLFVPRHEVVDGKIIVHASRADLKRIGSLD